MPSSGIKNWRWYAAHFRRHKPALALSILLALLQSVPLACMAWLVQYFFDVALPGKNLNIVAAVCGAFLILQLVRSSANLMCTWLNLKIVRSVAAQIRIEMFQVLFSLSPAQIQEKNPGELHHTIVADTQSVDFMTNSALISFLPAAFASIGLCAYLAYVHWITAFCILLLAPMLIFSVRQSRDTLRHWSRLAHSALLDYSASTRRVMDILPLIHDRGYESQAIRQQTSLIEKLHGVSRKSGLRLHGYAQSLMTAAVLGIAAAMFVGGYFVISGSLSVGDLLAFCAALALLRQQVTLMSASLPKILEGTVSLGRIADFSTLTHRSNFDAGLDVPMKQCIRVNGLSFGYGDKPVLRGMDFKVKIGEAIRVRGANGAGKSTLIQLLLAYISPDQGEVLVDETSLAKLNLPLFRRRTGILPQHPILFPGTVRDNILFGHDHESTDVEKVLRHSFFKDFFADLECGMDTVIAEDGNSLSGGQKQCIAIARAVAGSPTLLLLDEPGNHLSEDTYSEFIQYLISIKPELAIIVISHDQRPAELFDREYSLHNGLLSEIRDY